jgi:DNA-binding transcriptional ArsR family regulator
VDSDEGRDRPPVRRAMTAGEAKALGHPTRLRIVFACRERAMTNKELAEALGTTPGTIHYHLRPLVEQGFLDPLPARPGPRGSREQPYRATGRSWELAGSAATVGALSTVAADELLAAAPDDVVALTRLGLRLTEAERDHLVERLGAVLEEVLATTRDRSAGSDSSTAATQEVTVLVAVTTAADTAAPPG